MSLEQFLENLTLEEIEELKRLKLEQSKIYSFSNINFLDLEELFNLSENIDNRDIFDNWFNSENEIKEEDLQFLNKLLEREKIFISKYKEEDLKVNFIAPIIQRVNFKILDKKIRDFYDEQLIYKSDHFTLKGKVDYLIAKGFEFSHKPYFFIQEFKKSIPNDDPRPQLLAELISAVELNNLSELKGAYIIGSIWNFVILQRLKKHQYIYYVSQNFDSSKIEDLKAIYKNLVYVKSEIISQSN